MFLVAYLFSFFILYEKMIIKCGAVCVCLCLGVCACAQMHVRVHGHVRACACEFVCKFKRVFAWSLRIEKYSHTKTPRHLRQRFQFPTKSIKFKAWVKKF